MKVYAKINRGSYRNEEITGTFDVLQPWKNGANGGFIKIMLNADLQTKYNRQDARVKVAFDDLTYYDEFDNEITQEDVIGIFNAADAAGNNTNQMPVPEHIKNETPEERDARIAQRFKILDRMVAGAVKGTIPGLIISGPPGIGKSHSVDKWTARKLLQSNVAGKDDSGYTVVKGATTGLALYQMLYDRRGRKDLIVFDDCDNIFDDDLSLNLLKAALDSGRKRMISWNAESHVLKRVGVPTNFEFAGNIIFLTNVVFENVRSKKLKPHLDALRSRCLYFNLELYGDKDMMTRIEQVMDGQALEDLGLNAEDQEKVMGYIRNNVDKFDILDLRTVVKLAQLYTTYIDEWEEMADEVLLRPSLRHKS